MRPGKAPGADLGAVVLTGGSAVRLDGADKASLEIGGRTLLEHALAALEEVPEVVVVGDEVPASRPVTFRREEPAGGGPLAGLLAGLDGFVRSPRRVVALAVDMPFVGPQTISRLCLGLGPQGAILVDDHGSRQYLCAIYDTAAVRLSAPPDPYAASMRSVVDRLDLAEVPAIGNEARDVDTWADVRDLRQTLATGDRPGQDWES